MWNIKMWKLNEKDKALKWVETHKNKYQIEVIYVNNRYAVQYRKLITIC